MDRRRFNSLNFNWLGRVHMAEQLSVQAHLEEDEPRNEGGFRSIDDRVDQSGWRRIHG